MFEIIRPHFSSLFAIFLSIGSFILVAREISLIFIKSLIFSKNVTRIIAYSLFAEIFNIGLI